MRSPALTLLFCVVSVAQAQAQYQTTSSITDNGVSVLMDYSSNTMSPIVLTGKFSNPRQTTDDFVTFDASGDLVCSQNNNDGTFTQTVTSTRLVLPLTAVRVLNFGTQASPATDTIFVGHDYSAGQNNTTSSTLSSLSFTNCVPVESDVIFSPSAFHGPIESISPISSGSIYLTLDGEVGVIPNQLSNSIGLSNVFASSTVVGPFDFTGLTYAPSFLTQITQTVAAQPAPVTIALADTIGASTGVSDQESLEGDYFLGFVFDASGNMTAFSYTNDTVYADQLSIKNTEIALTNVGSFVLNAVPVAMLSGNFENDTQNSDLAIAAGNQIYLLEYRGASGTAAWLVTSILQASGTIGALTTGPLASSTSDDLIAQVGTTAEIFSSETFTLTVPLPPPPTYTLTVTTNGSGSVTANPQQTSYLSGSAVTLTATPGINDTFTGWSGACTGANPVCTLTITADLSATATFATPALTPSVVIAPPSAAVSAGSGAMYAVTPQNFSATPILTASCPTLTAAKGSCSIQNGQLVTTTTPSTVTTAINFPGSNTPLPTLWMLTAIMLAVFVVLRKPKARLAVAVPIVLLSGCAGGQAPVQKQIIPGTPSGAYVITVTANASQSQSQPQSAQATATLTVQ
jgi:uncharacterized repeat protein (TIGR02543 family)